MAGVNAALVSFLTIAITVSSVFYYDCGLQKQLDVYIGSLRQTLWEYGASEILEIEKGVLRVRPDAFTCDACLFYSGDSDMINAYHGEYMSSYS